MSIAITAPQKFAFQDSVCIEIMLRFFANDDATLFVEPDGGEDAELTFTLRSRRTRCEIQVKGAEGAIALDDFAACLAHAPPRCAEPTLLERLIADPDRLALLVMSGRANDDCAIYLGKTDWLGERHATSQIRPAHVTAFIAAFAVANVAGSDGGKLKTMRQTHNSAFAASAEVADVREALNRTIMFDQVDDGELDARCAERLRSDHGVPSDRTAAELLELRAAVAEAKSNKVDAFPLLRSILARAAPPPIRPCDYIARGDEADLVESLSNDNVLLLSGTPRVGKTYTARWIAAEFMPLGYDVKEFADVDSAERFLLEPGTVPRLALLDDPLGGAQFSTDATRALSRLTSLITRTRPQRKLLAAQGLEPLLATNRTTSLEQTVTARRRWRDMGNYEATFLVGLWQSLASTFTVDTTLCEKVTWALETGALVLEPGCLEHLAANADRLRQSATIADVARLAREDAAQLGRTLTADGLEDLTVSLAVATAPHEPIRLPELAYVRGSGGTGLPGKRTALGTMVRIGGPPIPPAVAPTYDEPPELAAFDQSGIDKLERRRLITIDARPAVGFAHPFYRAAAETLLDAPTYLAAQAVVSAVCRGLFCLSPKTSRATARNLAWIFDRLASRPTQRDALVREAIAGLRSLYPATRDLCFRFLLNVLSSLPAEQQQELPTWIASVTSVKFDYLEWSDGEAHLPYGEQAGIDYVERHFRTVSHCDVAAELTLLDTPESLVSPDRASAVLQFLATAPDTMTPTMAGRLLSYDEAALRAEAAKLWLSRPRAGDDEILDRIFNDDHPSCAIAALKGVIRGWRNSPTDRRAQHLDGLAALAGNIAAAAAMLDFLVLFDRVEHTGENPPWEIFERLMPVVMTVLPHNAAFIDARLFGVARSALDALSASSLVALCDGWIDWLERNERAGRLPSEFSLGVTEILLQSTAAEPERREGRVARLLAFKGTGAKITFVADLIDHWELLQTEERTAVLARLKSGSSDDSWLQAVALTRSNVPPAVARELLPDGIDLTQPPAQLIDALPQTICNAAIQVYAGEPQPLWWLGSHHSGKVTWEPVMETVARRPDHPLFELAWDHIARGGDGERVARILIDLGSQTAERALYILLRLKVGCTGNFMPEAWAALLRFASDPEEHARWLGKMIEASPAILDDISDLPLWLSEECDLRAALEKLQNDLLPLKVAKIVFDTPGDTDEFQDGAIKVLTLLCRERPPRLFGTCDRLISGLKHATVDTAELMEALQERRTAIFAEREIIEDSMRRWDPPLVGWITP